MVERFFVSLTLMKKYVLPLLFVILSLPISSQEKAKTPAFKEGEWLQYKLSYSGFLRAGIAELSLKKDTINDKEVMHAKGYGRTSTVIGWFFKVRDTYQTFMDIDSVKPYLFKRDVYEGGHIIKRDITFNHQKNIAKVEDFKYNTVKEFPIDNVQDMLSCFYYLRSLDVSNIKENDEININMFFDSKTYPFKLKFLGKDVLRTKFGKIKTLKFRPIVQAGRVFKENESVTIWVSADANKIPIRMKASLAVGSLRAELKKFKGLPNPFEVIFD